MRSVPEWVGRTDDAKIPAAVKRRIFEREGGICSLTGRKIRPGDDYDFEHKEPLWRNGKHAESNIVLALRGPHREKTAAEATERAKADRIYAKHNGFYPPSPFKIKGRGFDRRGAR